MSAIINIGSVRSASQVAYDAASITLPARAAESRSESDTVELSTLGQALSHATELSSLSVARIRSIRAAIAEGTFETPERINETAARIMQRIG